MSTKESNDFLVQISRHHVSLISCETTRNFFTHHLDGGDFLPLCDYEPDYLSLSVCDAVQVRQICAFFSKRADLVFPGIVPTRVAEVKFIESESLCRETNILFSKHQQGLVSFPADIESALLLAQRKIARILGPVPLLDDLRLRFGPGATTNVPRRCASAQRKLSAQLSCSEDLADTCSDVLETLPALAEFNQGIDGKATVRISDGKLVFVPKNFKTLRSVIIEPALNSMVQLGINDHIVSRLLKFGLDLSDQSLNQRLALEGSLTGALATLDLSSASDTISKNLVLDLLPLEWVQFLSRFRTSTVTYQGLTFRLEKFSSMGNGFTFPLESLIFYALASSCCEKGDTVTVYGDDIIAPTSRVAKITRLLTFVGFVINEKKSFSAGPFRESCGADYLSGIDIRPLYQKGPLSCFDLFRMHNFYVRTDRKELATNLLTAISPNLHKFGPDGYGDGHLLGDYRARPHGRDRGWCGHTFETFKHRSLWEAVRLPGDRILPFYSTYISGAALPLPSRSDFLLKRLGLYETMEIPERASSSSHRYVSGRRVNPLPGRDAYDLIKIYVLND